MNVYVMFFIGIYWLGPFIYYSYYEPYQTYVIVIMIINGFI